MGELCKVCCLEPYGTLTTTCAILWKTRFRCGTPWSRYNPDDRVCSLHCRGLNRTPKSRAQRDSDGQSSTPFSKAQRNPEVESSTGLRRTVIYSIFQGSTEPRSRKLNGTPTDSHFSSSLDEGPWICLEVFRLRAPLANRIAGIALKAVWYLSSSFLNRQ